MNKLRVFLGIVFSVITVLSVVSVCGILYGSLNPTHPVLLTIFLVILSIATGTSATGCLYKYVDVEYV